MAASHPGALVPLLLRRFQRRLGLAVFTRQVVFASALALAVADVAALLLPAEMRIGVIFATSLAFAAVIAGALAIARTPSLPETARIVDRELQLQDRAASALEFSRSEDPIACLLVREAVTRLEAVPPSRLPLPIPTKALWFAASALALSLAVVVSRGSPAPAAGGPGSGRASTETGAPPRNAQPGRGQDAAAATRRSSSKPTAPSTASREAAGQSLATTRTASGDNVAGRVKGMAQETPDARSTRGDSASPSSESRAGHATSENQQLKGGQRTLNPSSGGSPGAAAAASGAAGRGAGGVRGGALAASGSAAAQGTSDRRTAAYAEAYARAEAAVPVERVPAGLRSYVRAYFLAIRPGSQP